MNSFSEVRSIAFGAIVIAGEHPSPHHKPLNSAAWALDAATRLLMSLHDYLTGELVVHFPFDGPVSYLTEN